VAWLDELAKENDFPFGELAVELQGSADIDVVGLIEHRAVAASLQLIHGPYGYKCGRLKYSGVPMRAAANCSSVLPACSFCTQKFVSSPEAARPRKFVK